MFVISKCETGKNVDVNAFVFEEGGRFAFEGSADHEVKLDICWTEDALRIPISWQDNIWDTGVVPFDSVRWQHPSGRYRGDRMYYYDNLALRFFFPNRYYEAWISPEETPRLQWENYTRDGERQRRQVQAIMLTTGEATGELTAEIATKNFAVSLESGLEFDLAVVAPDIDMPDSTLVAKYSAIRYKHFRRTFRLQ